tara:strand:+ start:13791 stop:14426 length:636 start_codon:yes stop_codon:yes gene_type:complete
MEINKISNQQYNGLLSNISKIIEQGKREAYASLSNIIIKTYWEIGRQIVEFEQKGEKRAEYGKKLLDKLCKDLKTEHGKGFSRSNVYAMRQFYICFPNFPDTSGKLTWSHFVGLLGVSNNLECFVLIDLKIGKVKHVDVGQMNMYLNYFKAEENSANDNEPIGIILSAEKNEIVVKYALGGISNKLFVSKYQLYLPKTEDLKKEVQKLLDH